MKKTLSAILTLVLLCTSAFASPVLMGTVDSAQEKGAAYTETAASLTEEANDILGQLIFHEAGITFPTRCRISPLDIQASDS